MSRRASGQLEIYQLPSMRLVFSCGGLAEGPAVLSPAAVAKAAAAEGAMPAAPEEQPAAVVELRLVSFPEASSSGSGGGGEGGGSNTGGSGGSSSRKEEAVSARPQLLARLEDGTLLAYRAFATQQVS